MNYLQRLEYWGEAHHPKYLDILRIAFGIFLCIKGIEFANNTAIPTETMATRVNINSFLFSLIIQYTIFGHIIGGFLIAVGLLTRLACLLQIPILLGALVFVQWGVMQHFSQFFLALLTLILLCYFMVIGSGPWSLDRELWKNEKLNNS
jgi:putative oxidoreductase